MDLLKSFREAVRDTTGRKMIEMVGTRLRSNGCYHSRLMLIVTSDFQCLPQQLAKNGT